jgi:hypothetical protein
MTMARERLSRLQRDILAWLVVEDQRLSTALIIEYPISGGHSGDFCHNLRDRLRQSVAWVRVLIPCTNELSNLGLEVLFRVKIRDAQAFALENAEPLLHLVHPGAVDRRNVHHKSWMLDEPLPHFFAVMCADMIAYEMNRLDMGDNLRVQLFQNGDEFLWTLARVTLPKDASRTGVECGKYIQGSPALICMLRAVGNIPRLSGPRRSETRTRLSGGFLIN